MINQQKSKMDLSREVASLRARVAELEEAEAKWQKDQEDLARSRLVFQRMAEATPDLIFIYDLQAQRSVYINRQAKAILGYSPEEMHAMGSALASSLLHPEVLADHLKQAEQLRDGEVLEKDLQVRHAAGGFRWLHDRVVVFSRTPDGRVHEVLGIAQDISDRKRAEVERQRIEEKLRRSETMLAEAQHLACVGSWDWDIPTNAVTWSDELYRIHGVRPQEFGATYEAFLQCIHPEDREHVALIVQQACRDHKPFEYYKRVTHPDGSVRILHSRGQVIVDEAGNPVRMFGTCQDITEQQQAESQLRQTNETLAALIQASPLAVVTLDRQGHVVMWNPAAERLFGWSQQEVLGGFLPIVPEESLEEFRANYQDELQGKVRIALERKRRRKDGSLVDVNLWTAPLRDSQGEITAVMGIFADISEQKRTENQLREYAERLQALSRRLVDVQEEERRRLARELHDEIGQVLTAISMILHAAKDHAVPANRPRLDECLAMVSGAIDRVRNLSLDLRPSTLDVLGLEAALRWCLERQQERAGLTAEFVGHLSAQRLPADLETACFRVGQEALTNVVRHARARHVRVELRHQDTELQLEVRDDGIGFDLAAIREHGARGKSFGLQGMQERVELLGGRLDIESAPGRGTRVCARFPLPAVTEPDER